MTREQVVDYRPLTGGILELIISMTVSILLDSLADCSQPKICGSWHAYLVGFGVISRSIIRFTILSVKYRDPHLLLIISIPKWMQVTLSLLFRTFELPSKSNHARRSMRPAASRAPVTYFSISAQDRQPQPNLLFNRHPFQRILPLNSLHLTLGQS